MDKYLKIGWILMLILGIYRIILSVIFYQNGQLDIQNSLVFLSNAVAVVFIAWTAYKKAEKWSWWCMLLIGALPLISGTLWEAAHPAVIAGWVVLLVGLFLPIKAFFK